MGTGGNPRHSGIKEKGRKTVDGENREKKRVKQERTGGEGSRKGRTLRKILKISKNVKKG